MSVTYDHQINENAHMNPSPLSLDCIERVNRALTAAAYAAPPFPPDTTNAAKLVRGVSIMGYRLAPSPELHGGGAGVLDVDYADGETRTFDVASDGHLEPRRYAYAFATVIETERPLTEEERGNIIDNLPDVFADGTTIEFASTPQRIALNTGDYDVQPRDETEGGRCR